VSRRPPIEQRAHTFAPWLFALMLALILTVFVANAVGSMVAGTFPPAPTPPAAAQP